MVVVSMTVDPNPMGLQMMGLQMMMPLGNVRRVEEWSSWPDVLLFRSCLQRTRFTFPFLFGSGWYIRPNDILESLTN